MRLRGIRLKGIIALLLSLPLTWNALVFAERLTIESLQKGIDARGYTWKAGKTALSDLSPEAFQSMFGQKPHRTVRMMPKEERMTLADDFPQFLDWRDYRGGNWISPVKDQGRCGSCYAFGPVAAMESVIKLYYNNPDLPVDLSEQYLVSCGVAGCRGFDMPDTAMDHFFNRGVPDEACFPYQTIQFRGIEPPCAMACDDAASRIHRLSSYSFISGEGVTVPFGNEVLLIPYPENIKAVLVHKPVVCVMFLAFDWAFYAGGIYEPTRPTVSGHFAEIIGFDDAQQCWICKNSMGTDWGETADFKPYTPGAGDGGYFRIAYVTTPDTETCFGAFAADMNYEGGPPILTSTTTTIACPSEELYGEGSEELDVLRHFRDNVLSKTREGKELIELYYQWSPLVVKAMREDEELKKMIREMIVVILIAREEACEEDKQSPALFR